MNVMYLSSVYLVSLQVRTILLMNFGKDLRKRGVCPQQLARGMQVLKLLDKLLWLSICLFVHGVEDFTHPLLSLLKPLRELRSDAIEPWI
jgi:hypothetical protein